MARLVEATSAAQVAVVRELFAEYARNVDEPKCFVGFERELDTLPGRMTLGVLVIQDIYAIFILAFQPNFDHPTLMPILKARFPALY